MTFIFYIRATLTKIQQQLDDVKQSNNDSKSEILKSPDFNHAQVKELQEKVNSQDNSITALQQQLPPYSLINVTCLSKLFSVAKFDWHVKYIYLNLSYCK